MSKFKQTEVPTNKARSYEVQEAIDLYIQNGTGYVFTVLIPMADAMYAIQDDDPSQPSEAAYEAANRFNLNLGVLYNLRSAYQKEGCVALEVAEWFRARRAEFEP